MPELKREPTPVGPIKDLFDQLHALHRSAGEPPVRHVAAAIGPRVISHGTVYSVFRGPKVPKLGNVVQVVEALNGDVPRFSKLWQAARDAERELANRANRVSKSTGRGAVGALKNRISTATEGLREAVKRAEADIARYDRELIEATAGV